MVGCYVRHLLTGCCSCLSIINPQLITLFGLSAPYSWPHLHSRHKLPLFFNTHSLLDVLFYVSLGWFCIIQTMITCLGKMFPGVKHCAQVCDVSVQKIISWHLPSPPLLDSYTEADFINSPLSVVFKNLKTNTGIMCMIFSPFFFFFFLLLKCFVLRLEYLCKKTASKSPLPC